MGRITGKNSKLHKVTNVFSAGFLGVEKFSLFISPGDRRTVSVYSSGIHPIRVVNMPVDVMIWTGKAIICLLNAVRRYKRMELTTLFDILTDTRDGESKYRLGRIDHTTPRH
jgi:hypothetical protein